jgi:hypothetical protein
MAETVISATESALENRRIDGLQIRVAVICMLIQASLRSSPLSRRRCWRLRTGRPRRKSLVDAPS